MVRGWCPEDGRVLDLYAGLGSVARACALEGRAYVGAEIDPERHARALERLAMAVSRGAA
jgi:DNA modification methylase